MPSGGTWARRGISAARGVYGVVAALTCPACGRSYAGGPGEPWRCACGGPLERGELRLDGTPPAAESLDSRRGLWAFDDLLPVDRLVTLGEGMTPLVEAVDWDASFKLEYLAPTGSFKDRGASTTISQAMSMGVDRVVEDSSGNAGAAIAAYAARAGLDAEVFVPADADRGKRRLIERTGATVVAVEGSREAVAAACHERAEASDVWYASHAWRPSFLAGTATVAIEVCAARGWDAPDAFVLPAGHGTLLLGAYRGLSALRAAGWIDELPRLHVAQAAGCAPVVDALGGSPSGENRVADGLQIREPARFDELIEAVEATGGTAVAIDGDTTTAATDRLARDGFHVEPTAAVAPAALGELRERGVLDGDVVVPLTGSGLKG